MNEHREGGQVFWSARTKGCPEPFKWSIINVLYIYSNLSMQGRFKMEYRLLTIVRYNYRDYNTKLYYYYDYDACRCCSPNAMLVLITGISLSLYVLLEGRTMVASTIVLCRTVAIHTACMLYTIVTVGCNASTSYPHITLDLPHHHLWPLVEQWWTWLDLAPYPYPWWGLRKDSQHFHPRNFD
jgi:hypothetical protein